MHIVEFKGGLGNQLFELCFYYKLIEKYGYNNVFAYVKYYILHNPHEGFLIDKFIKLNTIENLPDRYINIDEENYYYVNYKSEGNYYYVGYWQSKEYFPTNMSFLNMIFNESNIDSDCLKISHLIKDCKNAVAIHVRRGDYVGCFIYDNIVNKQYFNNCINYVRKNIENPIFFVFSNDINWCKTNLALNSNAIYVSNHKSWMDIYLMSLCKINIISNSTFSWWAMTINKHVDKISFAPKYWYNVELKSKPLNTSNSYLIDNYQSHANYDYANDLTFVLFVNNEQLCKVRALLLSMMNQENIHIAIIVIIKRSDSNLKFIEEIAKKDRRIKILKKFFIKWAKIDMHLINNKFIIAKPEYFFKTNIYLDDKNLHFLLNDDAFLFIDGQSIANKLYNKCFSRQLMQKRKISIKNLLDVKF